MMTVQTKAVATPAKKNPPFFSKESGQDFFRPKSTDAPKNDSPFFSKTNNHSTLPIQPKLTVGAPNDIYEKEADAMANKVVQRLAQPEVAEKRAQSVQTKPLSTSYTPFVQAKCAHCEEQEKPKKKEKEEDKLIHGGLQKKPIFESNAEPPEDEKNIQRKCTKCEKEEKLQKKADNSSQTASPNIESRLNSSKGSGSSLPPATRSQMENYFGADFSNVRIHNDSSSAQLSKDLNAQAFTHGSDVYFNSGKYDATSNTGKHLLAHELTHVVQQGGNSIQKKGSYENSDLTTSTPAIQRSWYNFSIPFTNYEFDPSIEGVKTAAGVVKNKVVNGAEWIFDKINGLVNDGKEWLLEKWDTIKEFGKTCFNDIKNGFGNLLSFITNPLSTFVSALSLMNADILGGTWDLIKTGSNALWFGINSVVNGVMKTGQGIWNTVSGFINGIFNSISGMFNNVAFDLLPNWIKEEARNLLKGLQTLWNEVSIFWTELWQRLTTVIQEILTGVRSFIDNILNYGIGAVINMVRNLKEVYDYMMKVFADPKGTIQPLLDQLASKLNAEVPSKTKELGTQMANQNYLGGGPQSSNGNIQRAPIKNSKERETATLTEVGDGLIYYIAQAWNGLDLKKMLWDTVVNMFWPPATIKAIYNQFSQLWNDDWKTTLESLYVPRNFLEHPIGCLHDIWSNLLILLDFPLALWRTLNNVVGLLMGYISIIIILAEAILGGIAAVEVGVVPGILAGAAAGLATVATLGEALMASYLAAESSTVIVVLLRLFTAKQTCEKRQTDILTSVASFLTMAVALVLQILMALLAELVNLIASVLKAVPKNAPVPQPTPQPNPIPAQPVPAQPIPAQPVPAQPIPLQPVPAQPIPLQPVPFQPVPVQPLPVQPVAPGGQVIPFPIKPAITPSAPAIAAKFEDETKQNTFFGTADEINLSAEFLNNVQTTKKSNNDIRKMSLSSVQLSADGILQTSRKDQLNPDACNEEDCEKIVVPGYAPQDDISREHASRNGGVSGSLAKEVTDIREATGYKKLSDYYGNNIAGFIYGVFENDTSNVPIDSGTIVRKNDDIHSEERIVADLLVIRGKYPRSNVIRVDQVATERSACSTCYDLIRNSHILTANKIYTQRSGIYFIVRYTANRNVNAKALRERYCENNVPVK